MRPSRGLERRRAGPSVRTYSSVTRLRLADAEPDVVAERRHVDALAVEVEVELLAAGAEALLGVGGVADAQADPRAGALELAGEDADLGALEQDRDRLVRDRPASRSGWCRSTRSSGRAGMSSSVHAGAAGVADRLRRRHRRPGRPRRGCRRGRSSRVAGWGTPSPPRSSDPRVSGFRCELQEPLQRSPPRSRRPAPRRSSSTGRRPAPRASARRAISLQRLRAAELRWFVATTTASAPPTASSNDCVGVGTCGSWIGDLDELALEQADELVGQRVALVVGVGLEGQAEHRDLAAAQRRRGGASCPRRGTAGRSR